jgi:hypothetical protein
MTDNKNDSSMHTLGDSYHGANPVENALAINAWHAAFARVIAYAWEKWDDQEELDNIVKYPEYYLIQFGFFPHIPAYQTKIKFVIRKDDGVSFVSGGTTDKTKIITTVRGVEKTPDYMNQAPTYQSKCNVNTAGLVPLKDLLQSKTEAEIETMLKLKIAAGSSDLANGWHFEQSSELTGCFIVPIPAKPEVQANSCPGTDEGLLKTQALNDFMDICRSQPFTCC